MAGDLLFTPKAAGTVSITSAVTTANVALNMGGQKQVRVKNIDTTNVTFINFGNSAVTASATTGMPVGPGETCGMTVPEGTTHVAAICTAGTPIVYFTPGVGL